MSEEPLSINLDELKSLISLINAKKMDETIIENFNNTYELDIQKLSPISLYQVAEDKQRRVNKQYSFQVKLSKASISNIWHLGEKTLFFCTLIYYLTLKKISIQSITEKDLLPLKKIFLAKDISMLLFQAKHLLCKTTLNKNQWRQEDIERLKEIMASKKEEFVKNEKCFRWKQVSYDIFIHSTTGEFYSAKDCRQKWINHLNPQLVKATWSHKEDIELFTTINLLGCKWSQISKKMGRQRTQHMVKNRAKALLKRYFKKNIKHIENRHITTVLEALRANEQHFSQERQGFQSQEVTQKKELPALSYDYEKQGIKELEDPFVDIGSNKLNFLETDDTFYRLVLIQNMDEHWQYKQQAHSFDFFSAGQFKYSEDLKYPF